MRIIGYGIENTHDARRRQAAASSREGTQANVRPLRLQVSPTIIQDPRPLPLLTHHTLPFCPSAESLRELLGKSNGCP